MPKIEVDKELKSDAEILKEALKSKVKDSLAKEEIDEIETIDDLVYWSGVAGIKKAIALTREACEKELVKRYGPYPPKYEYPPYLHDLTDRESWCLSKGREEGQKAERQKFDEFLNRLKHETRWFSNRRAIKRKIEKLKKEIEKIGKYSLIGKMKKKRRLKNYDRT